MWNVESYRPFLKREIMLEVFSYIANTVGNAYKECKARKTLSKIFSIQEAGGRSCDVTCCGQPMTLMIVEKL